MPTLETSETQSAIDLRQLATDVVRRAMKGGATAAECVVREGDEFSTVVRLGQVETLKESGSRAIGVRVFFGQRAASTYTSDFSAEGIERMLKSALELAKICSEDPCAGIPEAAKLGSLSGDLHLYHEDVYSLPGPERIEYARRAEKAALDADPRIKNSEGGSFDAATGRKVARPHAARLLVFRCAQPGEARLGGAGRKRSRPPHPPPPRCAQGEDGACAGGA
ncbi:MAG: DNA gyrase modulator [Terriglobales bacterium]